MKSTLYIMVGLPGSGKSTFVKNHLSHCDYVLDTDSYIEEAARSMGKTYNDVFETHIKYSTKLMWQTWDQIKKEEFEEDFKGPLKVVWDQTNVTANKRRKILNTVPSHWRKVAVLVLSDTWREDSNRPGKSIPNEVLDEMEKSRECPSEFEGFDEMISGVRK